MNSLTETKAKEYFYQKNYSEALKLFLENENYYAVGLCSLLLKDVQSAENYWRKKRNECPASAFGLCVLNYISLKPSKIPSFFQTRAQLEIYLNLFIENNLIEWAENLISNCDNLSLANPETYKFIARALFANGYFKLAITFCKKSIKLCYCDPEALLILGQCNLLLGNLGEALDSVNRILDIAPEYYPALLLKDILKKEIAKKHENKN